MNGIFYVLIIILVILVCLLLVSAFTGSNSCNHIYGEHKHKHKYGGNKHKSKLGGGDVTGMNPLPDLKTYLTKLLSDHEYEDKDLYLVDGTQLVPDLDYSVVIHDLVTKYQQLYRKDATDAEDEKTIKIATLERNTLDQIKADFADINTNITGIIDPDFIKFTDPDTHKFYTTAFSVIDIYQQIMGAINTTDTTTTTTDFFTNLKDLKQIKNDLDYTKDKSQYITWVESIVNNMISTTEQFLSDLNDKTPVKRTANDWVTAIDAEYNRKTGQNIAGTDISNIYKIVNVYNNHTVSGYKTLTDLINEIIADDIAAADAAAPPVTATVTAQLSANAAPFVPPSAATLSTVPPSAATLSNVLPAAAAAASTPTPTKKGGSISDIIGKKPQFIQMLTDYQDHIYSVIKDVDIILAKEKEMVDTLQTYDTEEKKEKDVKYRQTDTAFLTEILEKNKEYFNSAFKVGLTNINDDNYKDATDKVQKKADDIDNSLQRIYGTAVASTAGTAGTPPNTDYTKRKNILISINTHYINQLTDLHINNKNNIIDNAEYPETDLYKRQKAVELVYRSCEFNRFNDILIEYETKVSHNDLELEKAYDFQKELLKQYIIYLSQNNPFGDFVISPDNYRYVLKTILDNIKKDLAYDFNSDTVLPPEIYTFFIKECIYRNIIYHNIKNTLTNLLLLKYENTLNDEFWKNVDNNILLPKFKDDMDKYVQEVDVHNIIMDDKTRYAYILQLPDLLYNPECVNLEPHIQSTYNTNKGISDAYINLIDVNTLPVNLQDTLKHTNLTTTYNKVNNEYNAIVLVEYKKRDDTVLRLNNSLNIDIANTVNNQLFLNRQKALMKYQIYTATAAAAAAGAAELIPYTDGTGLLESKDDGNNASIKEEILLNIIYTKLSKLDIPSMFNTELANDLASTIVETILLVTFINTDQPTLIATEKKNINVNILHMLADYVTRGKINSNPRIEAEIIKTVTDQSEQEIDKYGIRLVDCITDNMKISISNSTITTTNKYNDIHTACIIEFTDNITHLNNFLTEYINKAILHPELRIDDDIQYLSIAAPSQLEKYSSYFPPSQQLVTTIKYGQKPTTAGLFLEMSRKSKNPSGETVDYTMYNGNGRLVHVAANQKGQLRKEYI